MDEVSNQVATETHLLREKSKHATLVLRNNRIQKQQDVNWLNWIEIIIDESLIFKEYWKSRIAKGSKMLGKLNGLGNSMWRISTNSCSSA